MPVAAIILDVVLQFITIIAFLAVTGASIHFFLEKTTMGARVKAATPWMGWTTEDEVEDAYTNFVIHPANYIKVPSSR